MDGFDLSQRVELIGAKKGLKIPRLFTKPNVNVFDMFEWKKCKSTIRNPDGTIVFEMDNVEVPVFWSQTATDILAQKYFRRKGVPQYDENGNLILDVNGKPLLAGETSLKQVVNRLAGCWRYWGEKYGYFASPEDAQVFEDEIKFMLINQMAAPNSPQWFNTGLHFAYNISGSPRGHWYVDPDTKQLVESKDEYSHPQIHACFIQSIKDDLLSEGGIMDLWVREARIFKYGSGTGTNFSTLRAKGEPLSGGGVASGVMSFLRIGDTTAASIKSGGITRRAAKMVILNIDHPEIEDFIEWKVKEEKKLAALINSGLYDAVMESADEAIYGYQSNNSVRVTDDFINAVIKDEDWHLIARTDGSVMKTVKAKYLWDKIAEAAWSCGDPGIQFDTTINDWHTCPASGRINASNPCSEYMFIDNTACNLASINLAKFLDEESGIFDVEAFKHAVRLWTIVLEISVLMAQYPSKEIALGSYNFRTLGLGYTNLGSVLMKLGLPYDSEEARAFCAAITAIMTGEAYATSAEMASFLGPFVEYEKNKEHMLRVIRNHRRVVYNAPAEEYENLHTIPQGINHKLVPEYLMQSAIECWDRALALGEKYGYRNAQVTLIAPTGTISLIMDCDTTGIEPDFALVKFKKLAGGGYFKIVNRSVEVALKRLGYNKDQIKDILNYMLGTNTFRGAPFINDITLRTLGFTEEEIKKMEALLPSSINLESVFNINVLGAECLERLGFSKKEFSSPNFNLLKALGFKDREIEIANDYICGTHTIEGAPHIKEEHYPIFDCANKCGKRGKRFIDYMAHVKMMAAAQPLLSGAISKTINMPNEATVEDVKRVYFESWKLGLKALAIYRDGSKVVQVLYSSMGKQKGKEIKPVRRKMPMERKSITHKFRVGNQEGYLTVGLYEDGKPGEIFVHMAKQGSTLAGIMDSFAIAVSIALQYNVPLKTLVAKFINTRFEPMGWTDNPDIPVARSILDYIFKWLALKFLPEEDLKELGIDSKNVDLNEIKRDENIPSFEENIPSLTYWTTKEEVKIEAQNDAPPCYECGTLMIKTGSCYTCPTCGATSGCS
ncbi:MAG: vitamin B12-dependent ribonucleotide reductase [Candidatus Aenigmatarchaeota archaeon]